MKKFDPRMIHKLNDPKRFVREPIDKIWSWLELGLPATVVDLGAGSGFFTFPFSERLSVDSKIYACDISQDMLNYLQGRIPAGKREQIVPLLMQEEKLPVADNIADLVFLANVFHELDSPGIILDESKRVLKSKGKIAILEWKKEEMGFGPPMEIRWALEEIVRELKDHDFVILKEIAELPAHDFILARSE